MKRVLTTMITLTLLTFAPLALTGPASAQSGAAGTTQAAPASAGSTASPEARKRNMRFTGNRQGRSNRFFVSGRVTPNYSNKFVLIRQAVGKNNNYKPYKRVKTNRQGKFRTRVAIPQRSGGTLRYIALVKASGNFNAVRSARYYQITRG